MKSSVLRMPSPSFELTHLERKTPSSLQLAESVRRKVASLNRKDNELYSWAKVIFPATACAEEHLSEKRGAVSSLICESPPAYIVTYDPSSSSTLSRVNQAIGAFNHLSKTNPSVDGCQPSMELSTLSAVMPSGSLNIGDSCIALIRRDPFETVVSAYLHHRFIGEKWSKVPLDAASQSAFFSAPEVLPPIR